jgi:glycosyltransferase involved in cell wall biosynthesis
VSADLVILVPVLNRPHRVAPLLDSIEASAPGARVLFLVDRADTSELDAICKEMCDERQLCLGGMEVFDDGPGYAAKINQGARVTAEPFLFLGADDLNFKPGWYEAAKAAMVDGVEVVGVNDLLRRRRTRRDHATHFLMTREYAQRPTIDGETGPLCERYIHNFVDDELIATATARGVYAYAPGAHVEHLHWMNRRAAMDETYKRGRESFESDRVLFEQRRALWA